MAYCTCDIGPGPDHETWKWQPDPDTGEWYYDEELDGYAFHSPDWFEGNDQ
jgi:hypothetical protein